MQFQEDPLMKATKIYASTIATLDSNVHTGGGTDDTAALQAVLDRAQNGEGIHLIMDGAALISQLKLYSNTTIECLNKDCGFYQIDHTDDAMITNGNWNKKEVQTWNISLLGGTYNQNCRNQAHDNPHRNDDFVEAVNDENAEKPFTLCLEFYGVGNMLIRDITIAEFRTFAFTAGCFYHLTLENVWLDMKYHMNGNQDGFHFWGPGQYLTVRNCGGCVSDDIMNIGPDEVDKVSSITDVLVDGLFLEDAEQAVRLLSRGTGRLDRVTIRNITGQYRSYGFYINPWFGDDTCGNFGNIFIENVDLKEHPHTYEYYNPVLFSIGGNIECLTLKNIRHHNGLDARKLFEIGLPFGRNLVSYSIADDPAAQSQKLSTIIIDGLTITETKEDAPNRNYITIHDTIENFVLKNALILKDQPEENGTLIQFEGQGEIKNLLSESIYTKGLRQLTNDSERIRNHMKESKF